MKTILVTGGCGFIGQNFIKHVMLNSGDIILNLDSMTYASDKTFNDEIKSYDKRYFFKQVDINDIDAIKKAISEFEYKIDVVVHFAAESHVDNSIEDGSNFVLTNVFGTYNLLSTFREYWSDYADHKFIYISTDEVYGDIPFGSVMEDYPPTPRNPYSASKLGGESLCQSFATTYNFPIIITRSCNNYGPNQYPEKFIPVAISKVLKNKQIPIYGDGQQMRNWIHVDDHCSAIKCIIYNGYVGNVYNISTDIVISNLKLASIINEYINPETKLIEFIKDRPGHDRRYSIDSSKLRSTLQWTPQFDTYVKFVESLRTTINWYMVNSDWLTTT